METETKSDEKEKEWSFIKTVSTRVVEPYGHGCDGEHWEREFPRVGDGGKGSVGPMNSGFFV